MPVTTTVTKVTISYSGPELVVVPAGTGNANVDGSPAPVTALYNPGDPTTVLIGQKAMANSVPITIASDQSALSIRQLTASDVVTVSSSSASPVIAQIQDLLRSKNKVSVSADTAFVSTPTTALPNAAATSVPFGINTSAANYPKSQQILIQAVGTAAGTAVPTNVYFSFGTANASSFPIPGGTAGPLILNIEATSISIYNNSGGALQCNPGGGTAGIRLEIL